MNANHSVLRPLPHQKLVAYQVAVELLQAVIRCRIADARLREQALKSANSTCLNLAPALSPQRCAAR